MAASLAVVDGSEFALRCDGALDSVAEDGVFGRVDERDVLNIWEFAPDPMLGRLLSPCEAVVWYCLRYCSPVDVLLKLSLKNG